MKLIADVLVKASPEITFATITDVPHWPDFIPAVQSVQILSDGPVGVGTRFRETRLMHGREMTEEMTVATLTPARRFVLTAESHGARYLSEHIVESHESGARLTLTFTGTPVTFWARLLSMMAVVFAGSVQKMLRRDLECVAAEAARRAALPSATMVPPA